MSLNLEAIHPLYAPPEFASLYMRVLAENMTNEDWFDTSLEQRMWISRYLAFSHLYRDSAELFPEWRHTDVFNATVEETRRRRHQAGYLAESSIAAAATAVVRLNGATPAFQESGQLTKHCMQEIRVTQEIPQNVRQSLYQPKALRVDIYASHAGNFIGHRGRNCKYWVNEIQGVNDIFVLGHPDTQGTRKVAIISWYSGGQEGRERVRDLIKEFNIKTGSGDLSCEWLDEASRAWFREEQGDDGNIGKGRNKFRPRRRREDRERRQFELQGTDAVNYFGAA